MVEKEEHLDALKQILIWAKDNLGKCKNFEFEDYGLVLNLMTLSRRLMITKSCSKLKFKMRYSTTGITKNRLLSRIIALFIKFLSQGGIATEQVRALEL